MRNGKTAFASPGYRPSPSSQHPHDVCTRAGKASHDRERLGLSHVVVLHVVQEVGGLVPLGAGRVGSHQRVASWDATASLAVTHPANWGPYKRDLLDKAAEIAGLSGVILVTEPQAAAISYAAQERVDEGAVVAVYDLGGGTFDAAVLRKEPDGGFTPLMGDVRKLPSGSYLVGWSSLGRIEEITQGGVVNWRLDTPAPSITARVSWYEELYPGRQ